MEQIRPRYDIVCSIDEQLFRSERLRFFEQTQALIRENTRLGGSPDGFLYQGQLFSSLAPALQYKGKYQALLPVLFDRMDQLERDKKMVNFDRSRIKQALSLVLRDCHNRQDVRDALPNSLKDLVEECSGLDRTRPEAYTLLDNPRLHNQYLKLREKIDFYVAARLLY